ncbi:MAG: hypothetical protein WCW25_02030 [Patescibacteria group bacterium]
MFENTNQNNQNSGGQDPALSPPDAGGFKPSAPYQGQGNFSVNPQAPGLPQKAAVEDIFSQMDGGAKSRPEILGPKKSGLPGETGGEGDVFKKSMDSKRIVLAGIGLGGIILIFIGAWYSYNIFLPKRQEAKENSPLVEENAVNQPAVNTANTAVGNEAASEEESKEPEEAAGTLLGTDVLESPLQPGEERTGEATAVDSGRDSDNDGLKDLEEAELGTDPEKIDTDGDGLFDNEEVAVYKTDPLNQDTDGDSYPDGSEVKNGYDPKGPGKLFKVIPTE